MGRPKKVSSTTPKKPKVSQKEKTESTSIALASIRKKFGDGIMVNGDQIIETEREIVSVSPAIDNALGGGLVSGTIVVIGGQYRVGKTTTAMCAASNAQQMGKKVIFDDAEHRLGSREFTSINGLDPSKIDVIRSYKGNILSAENHLEILEDYLFNETDCFIVLDSISILSESREQTGKISDQTRGGSAKLVAQFMRRITPVVPVNNHILVLIAQRYANVSGQGKQNIVKIANSVNYALSTFIEFEYIKRWTQKDGEEEKEDAVQIGQKAHIVVNRSPFGPPNARAISYQRFGYGIDCLMETINVGEELGFVEKSGSWYSYGENKAQGMENFRQLLIDNPDEYHNLQLEIKGITE